MERRIRILIADNSAVIRRLIADALHVDLDFEVYPASNGKEAIELMSVVRPDLVVLDVEIPVMNGVETVSEIRKLDDSLPIIMLCKSLEAKSEATLAALAAGANDCVTKTIRIGHVQAAIEYIRGQLVPKIRLLTNSSSPAIEVNKTEATSDCEHQFEEIDLSASAASQSAATVACVV